MDVKTVPRRHFFKVLLQIPMVKEMKLYISQWTHKIIINYLRVYRLDPFVKPWPIRKCLVNILQQTFYSFSTLFCFEEDIVLRRYKRYWGNSQSKAWKKKSGLSTVHNGDDHSYLHLSICSSNIWFHIFTVICLVLCGRVWQPKHCGQGFKYDYGWAPNNAYVWCFSFGPWRL